MFYKHIIIFLSKLIIVVKQTHKTLLLITSPMDLLMRQLGPAQPGSARIGRPGLAPLGPPGSARPGYAQPGPAGPLDPPGPARQVRDIIIFYK